MRNHYPYLRVFIAFALCPFAVGFVYGLLGFVMAFVYVDSSASYMSPSAYVGAFFFLPIAGAFTGLFYFGIPSVLVSVVYAVLRIYKSWYGYIFVAVCGGGAAHLWLPVMIGDAYVSWGLFDVGHWAPLLGALSSLTVAFFALPFKEGL
ncbi:hypothetical protein ACMYUJ_06260 [Stutzerimonas zhaodongensis]|uniref:hypothetical protein n=1 Tax=Stutzerimonas zhaodongensis TaxID=1176257 RepID=UPI0039F09EE0